MPKFIAISIGSNVPDAQIRVADACLWLKKTFSGVKCSECYSTYGIGERSAGKTYTNAVAVATTTLSADDVTTLTKRYEKSTGRIHGDLQVPIDLDLVVYDDIILRPDDFEQDYFKLGYRQLLG